MRSIGAMKLISDSGFIPSHPQPSPILCPLPPFAIDVKCPLQLLPCSGRGGLDVSELMKISLIFFIFNFGFENAPHFAKPLVLCYTSKVVASLIRFSALLIN